MKLVGITISNYRQFEKAELNFDEGITVLAGANNSGKTSLVNLIKNVFIEEKNQYSESDVPAINLQKWIDNVYPFFQDFFENSKSIEKVEDDLVELFIPKSADSHREIISTTNIKIHVSYDPDTDDIKLFADYIMDLDEKMHNFYFEYCYEINRIRFVKTIVKEHLKLVKRFLEIKSDKEKLTVPSDEKAVHNIELKERYLKQKIVSLYISSIVPVCYFCDKEYENKCKIDDINDFRNLFNFCFIKASRPLDDDSTDHVHAISKQMIKMAKADDKWNELVEHLPDEILKPIQEKDINKTVRETSLNSLKETITALEQTNGGQSGELMLDMQVTEDDISDLLQRITTATYNVNGYYLGESSQGLGYSNMIYIHLQLNEYEKSKNPLKVNIFIVEEPESHMHPQMQQVFIKYLIEHYKNEIQGLVTTHSNEMVRVAGITHLRVIRKTRGLGSKLYDPSVLMNDLKKSIVSKDQELANFYDWFFEIGYSELIFADKAIFYEGDTERLYIRKLLTLEKYEKLKQQYIAYIQVGGAYAKNYRKMIELLKIKSLIITDIDYSKDAKTVIEISNSKTTNATINEFYAISNPNANPTVSDLYLWKKNGNNVVSDLIYTCFQTDDDGYARTLEEAMLSKYYNINVMDSFTLSEWEDKRKSAQLDFSLPRKDKSTQVFLRDILNSSAGKKTNFMYSVIMSNLTDRMEPDYISGGLKWLME